MESLEFRLKSRARELGFDLVGIAPATPPDADAFREWLAQGFAGEMAYMHKHAAAREDPNSILAGVRSVVMVAENYRTAPAQGGISCYAHGGDYHDWLRAKLNQLLDWLQTEVPGVKGRGVVDTAPLLERDFARLAGLGWFGKNTMLLNKKLGSYFFIGAMLLDMELKADPPFEFDHCGTCTTCLDACPTQAFVGPGRLDSRKCISYLTIELRGPIPAELRPMMGEWIYGCDVCQDICPWNRKSPVTNEPAFQPRDDLADAALEDLLRLTPAEFRDKFRGTAITRTKRRGLLRNVAIALGNRGDVQSVPALIEALRDEEPLVRGAAAWALGEIATAEANAALQERQPQEPDAVVWEEIRTAQAKIESKRQGLSPPMSFAVD